MICYMDMYKLFWLSKSKFPGKVSWVKDFRWVDVGDVMGIPYTDTFFVDSRFSPEMFGIEEHIMQEVDAFTGRWAYVLSCRMSLIDWWQINFDCSLADF